MAAVLVNIYSYLMLLSQLIMFFELCHYVLLWLLQPQKTTLMEIIEQQTVRVYTFFNYDFFTCNKHINAEKAAAYDLEIRFEESRSPLPVWRE